MVTFAAKAARYLIDHHLRKDQLMIERGLGYLISPDGEFVPTPPRVSHADIMRELIDAAALSDEDRDAFAVDPNAFAISKGWTRVRIYPGQQVTYVDFGAGRQSSHRAAVDDLLDQLGFVDVNVKYTDEQGNYVSP